MDGRSDPDLPDGVHFAARRMLCVRIPVSCTIAPRAVLQTAVLSAAFPSAVSPVGRHIEADPVYPAFRSADGRGGDAFDPAARRNGLCRRNDDRDGPAACGNAFGGLRAVSAAADPETAFGSKKTCAAYRACGKSRRASVPARCVDRQRESAEGTDFGLTGHFDRPRRRPTAAADSVCESVDSGRSVRGTADLGHAPAVRQRSDRLLSGKGAGTDRFGAGDPAGKPFTV